MGSSSYAVRDTRLDCTYGSNRLARFGMIGQSAKNGICLDETQEYCLHMTNAGDVWEALELGISADSEHNDPRSTSGVCLALIGPAGSCSFPLGWLSRVLAIRGTSREEDESMSWGIAVRLA